MNNPKTGLRAKQALALRAQGLIYREIAERMGISRAYANALVTDPSGAQDEARKERYRGTCEGCGKPTTGSDGPGKAPTRCVACRNALNRYWTRETVVGAIQEWNRRYGRPPLSDDWIRSVVDEDDYRFPPRAAVYRSTTNPTAPFDRWADAVEAAGFPRPFTGSWAYARERRTDPVSNFKRDYLVLRIGEGSEAGSTDRSIIGIFEASDGGEAIDGLPEGTYDVVPLNSLQRYHRKAQIVSRRALRRVPAATE